MAARVFGPILGAGTQVNEETGSSNIIPGEKGSTVFMGPFERGTEQDITLTQGRAMLKRKMGELLDPADFATPSFASLYTPLMAQHFVEEAEGAGTLVCLRVVPTTNDATNDDRVTKSSMTIFNREDTPKVLGTATAHNGGTWAGKRKVFLADLSGTPATDFPAANQIQLTGVAAKTLKRDEFRGGYVYLDGLPSNSYRIVNNSSNGLLTLEADADVITDWGTGATYAGETTSAGPYNLGTVATPHTVQVTTDLGGPITATIAHAPAGITNGAAPTGTPYGPGDALTMTVNGTAYAVDLNGDTSAADIADAINTQVPGVNAYVSAGGVDVDTDREGTGATFNVTASGVTLTQVFGAGYSITATGTGDVANHLAATATELATAIQAAAGFDAIAEAVDNGNNTFTLRTDTLGAGGTFQENGGSLQTLLGLTGVLQTGTNGPADLHASLVRGSTNSRNQVKSLALQVINGGFKPDTEFGIVAFVDGKKVLSYENLSMQTSVSNYWVDKINNDVNNDIFTVADTFTGDRTQASARPANQYGLSKTLTSTRLTIADPHISNLTVGVGAWVPSLAWNSWGASVKRQRLRVTMSAPTTFNVTTDQGTRTWSGTLGVALDMEAYVGSITVTTGSGAVTVGDYFDIYVNPLEIDEAIGGTVFPNVTDVAQKSQSFTIIDNGVNYVDISVLQDLTDGGSNVAGKAYRIVYKQQLEAGYDGYLAGMTSADYEQLIDISTTPLRKLTNLALGLVKVSAPGTSYYTNGLVLQQKLKLLAAEYNWMAKVEIPWSLHDYDVYKEYHWVDWLNDTYGRDDNSDYTATTFPAYCYVSDPFASEESDPRNILVPVMGMVLGEEARIAVSYENHHKAPAGINAQLPKIVELPVVGKPDNSLWIDEEVTNPAGINLIKWKRGGGVAIMWGDRTLSQNSNFKFYHKRCLLSQYENDLQQGFDFTIFEINDPIEDQNVLAALHDYFFPEYNKRAIRGDSFVGGQNPAAIFKMDSSNNTVATRAAGDQIVEISLRLADTIERLRIFIGPQGVVEGSV
jgi:hypothetical protein